MTDGVEVWTDGSCWPNPGPGGWAAIVVYPDGATHELTGWEARATNNRMEMLAVIEPLATLIATDSAPVVWTDSQYVQRGVTMWMSAWKAHDWTRRERGGRVPISNLDLWARMDQEIERTGAQVRWTRGHAGTDLNERADRLASGARRRGLREAEA